MSVRKTRNCMTRNSVLALMTAAGGLVAAVPAHNLASAQKGVINPCNKPGAKRAQKGVVNPCNKPGAKWGK